MLDKSVHLSLKVFSLYINLCRARALQWVVRCVKYIPGSSRPELSWKLHFFVKNLMEAMPQGTIHSQL